MKVRLAPFGALFLVGAFASTLEGASSRISLSGGPLARSDRARVPVLHASAPIRALQPGEMLVLGPTAGPVTADSNVAPAPAPAPPPVPAASAATDVDTVTVRAPAGVSEAPRSSRTGESWEGYRSGNVVRIDLP